MSASPAGVSEGMARASISNPAAARPRRVSSSGPARKTEAVTGRRPGPKWTLPTFTRCASAGERPPSRAAARAATSRRSTSATRPPAARSAQGTSFTRTTRTGRSGGTQSVMAARARSLAAASSSATTTSVTPSRGIQASRICPCRSRLSTRTRAITGEGRPGRALDSAPTRSLAARPGPAPQELGGERDVLLAVDRHELGRRLERQGLGPRGRELQDHREVHPGDDLELLVEEREREVRGGAAEHVREDEDAVPRVDPVDRVREPGARVLHGGAGPDAHRLALLELADDGLGGAQQLLRELPVRGDDESDHGSPGAVPPRGARTIAAR